MLALTRKKGDSIIINDNIEIVVLDIQGDQIRLGINAPKNITIHRKEIYDQILKENEQAAVNTTKAIDNLNNLLKSK